ncbi:Unknown protein [Striga hermonthica]|uniref:Uncharacterized protein n=1 Tax=Striga hermonthica TaxID=68872 RepID=A0A9N7N9C9_STRHE|nr:Unknown protein [Striga hermonthica]
MGRNLLQYGVVALAALASVCGGRDLRPSDHGLAYQETSPSPPPQQNDDARGTLSFFGGTASSSVELPEARNISDSWWSSRGGSDAGREARGAGRDRVRLGLLVASGVCGLTGGVLLVVSGVVFLFRHRNRKMKADGVPSTSAAAIDGQAVNGN